MKVLSMVIIATLSMGTGYTVFACGDEPSVDDHTLSTVEYNCPNGIAPLLPGDEVGFNLECYELLYGTEDTE